MLDLPPVDGTHASTIALLYMYTVLDLLPVHGTHASTIALNIVHMYTDGAGFAACTWYTYFNYWFGFVVLFACCIIYLMISSACLSV